MSFFLSFSPHPSSSSSFSFLNLKYFKLKLKKKRLKNQHPNIKIAKNETEERIVNPFAARVWPVVRLKKNYSIDRDPCRKKKLFKHTKSFIIFYFISFFFFVLVRQYSKRLRYAIYIGYRCISYRTEYKNHRQHTKKKKRVKKNWIIHMKNPCRIWM